jgi:hypothetical protein
VEREAANSSGIGTSGAICRAVCAGSGCAAYAHASRNAPSGSLTARSPAWDLTVDRPIFREQSYHVLNRKDRARRADPGTYGHDSTLSVNLRRPGPGLLSSDEQLGAGLLEHLVRRSVRDVQPGCQNPRTQVRVIRRSVQVPESGSVESVCPSALPHSSWSTRCGRVRCCVMALLLLGTGADMPTVLQIDGPRLLSTASELRAGRVCRRRAEGCSAEFASPAASALTVPGVLR